MGHNQRSSSLRKETIRGDFPQIHVDKEADFASIKLAPGIEAKSVVYGNDGVHKRKPKKQKTCSQNCEDRFHNFQVYKNTARSRGGLMRFSGVGTGGAYYKNSW